MQTFYPPVLAIEKHLLGLSTEARNLEKVSVPSAQSVSLNSRDAVGSRGVFDRHPDRAPGGQLAGAAGSGIDKLGMSTTGSR